MEKGCVRMPSICPTHNKELKRGKYGFFCPTPITKDSKGNVVEWCDYNPGGIPQSLDQPVQLTPTPVVEEQQKAVSAKVWEDKDLRIARESALHTASRNNMGKQISPMNLIAEADMYVKFIYDGRTIEFLEDEELEKTLSSQ